MSDSESDEESFHDAVEYLARPEKMDLSTSIDEAKIAMNLFLNNNFDEARAILKPWANESFYHALGTGVFSFLEAMLTFEQQHIEQACAILEQSVEVCNRFRKKNSVYESLGKIVRKPNYDVLREEEIHAELCYAECLLLRAALTFVEDENLISFVKGGLKMRSCLNAYKECWHILKHRNWDDCKYKIHFESGARMGIGSYNLMISMLPARIMKLLEFIGFSGSREVGLQQLEIGSSLVGSIRQILCAMSLLGYHLFVCYVLGFGEGDLVLCDKIITNQLSMYPNGIWYPFFKARLEYVQGHINEAIELYTQAWQSQSEWSQFHHLCFWELMFCNSFKQDWCSSRDFADLLLHESKWSKAIYGYQKASFMCMMSERLGKEEKEELSQLFKDIPQWKQRIAGKSIPMEKFIVKKCERFFAQGNKLVLPAIELIYLWNSFKILGKQVELVQPLHSLIEKHIKLLEKNRDQIYYVDNKGLAYLLKGMCLKYLNCPTQASDCFLAVISLEKQLSLDHYLVPYATYELGSILWSEGSREEAVITLENAKNNYKGYALESRLHFRVHSALADIKSFYKNDSTTNGSNSNSTQNGSSSTSSSNRRKVTKTVPTNNI